MSVNGLGSVEEETEILIGKEDKGTPKGRKDYEREALAAKAKFLDLINDTDGWTEIKSEPNGVKIESRRSAIDDNDILLATIELDASAETVLALVLPWLPYRIKWDDILQSLHVIDQVNQCVYLVQHVTKKRLTMSARESIDVVGLGKTQHFYYVTSSGTTHEGFPVNDKFVRTHQHIAGYAIYFNQNANRCQFKMLFHADLNISGPKLFLSTIIDWAKPKLMTEKLKCLKKAVSKVEVDDCHIKALPV